MLSHLGMLADHPSYIGQDDDTSVARSENEHAGPSGPSGLAELSDYIVESNRERIVNNSSQLHTPSPTTVVSTWHEA